MATDPPHQTAAAANGFAVTYTARVVFPVAGPPLPGGTLTVAGDRILAVEPRGARAADVDLGNVALIPGLVNAHTHLDLSGARGLVPPADAAHFTDWLRGVIAYRRGRTPEQVQADIRVGLAEALRAGTTLLGDIAAEGASWDAVAATPLRAVVFHELIGLPHARAVLGIATARGWVSGRTPTPLCRPGLSPHAPYSVNARLHKEAVNLARETRFPVAVHLAESPAELELLRRRRGPLVEFLKRVGAWEPDGLAHEHEEWLVRRLRRAPDLYVHANYLTPTRRLPRSATVVYCPRTHAAFGHPPHPVRDFLARGVRVCLGTDSLASNPDLDPLAEARFVRARRPDVAADLILKMVTLAGAEALGWADEAGSLEAGKSADAVAVPLPDRDAADPHELLLADHPGARRTLFRGAWRD
ncbi:amidohydrolase family protein [Urbifossiella limnaea]|uniref:amidohydrolase family protein n=1 Tax=Urbifossiella limnaea TaxID=2528023 RepID=UPI00192E430D|nr:amidohydrolase family protein [Urbifossiella limnaea]